MPESNELFNEVAQLRDEVEEQGAMIDALVHIGGGPRREEILAALEKDKTLREVYLQIDGRRTQGEIVADLEARNVAKKSSVSDKFDLLANEYNLIQLVRRSGGSKVYRRTRLGKTLKIDRALERKGATTNKAKKS